ncbi:VOC family protein [Pseudonocardia endophytica]
MAFLQLTTIMIRDYDATIRFFTGLLGFELIEDSAAFTNDGRTKRWVVVRPASAQTGLLLAQVDGGRQLSVLGDQHAGRVGFSLEVDDFDAHYERMRSLGVEFVTEPRAEPYGRFAVFLDISGNRWDLIEPRPNADTSVNERRLTQLGEPQRDLLDQEVPSTRPHQVPFVSASPPPSAGSSSLTTVGQSA